jgi:hypothetical protein
MALIGKRDGRNFGYGRQLSYSGHKRCGTCLAAAITARSKRTVIVGRRLCAGVGYYAKPNT